MKEINIYCDETNHLLGKYENNIQRFMILGAIQCPRENTKKVNQRIKEIKAEHNLPETFEIKWTKVTKKRLPFFIDLINYFFDVDFLNIRMIIIDKNSLDHEKYSQTHSEWYYKMYYLLLTKIISSDNEFRVFVDKKDTLGKTRINKLHEVLCNSEYDFQKRIIKEIREVHSDQVQIVQITDLIIGAMQFNLCSILNNESESKRIIVNKIKDLSKKELIKSTLPSEKKFNIFFWKKETNI